MTRSTRALALAAALSILALASAACSRGEGGRPKNSAADSGASPGAQGQNAAPPADVAALDAEIARLEKLVGRNPADQETTALLARTHVRRGDAHRAAGRLREALDDYRRAQRLDRDNEEALKNISEILPAVEGTPQEGEYGDPPPLPVDPAAGGEEKPTPKR